MYYVLLVPGAAYHATRNMRATDHDEHGDHGVRRSDSDFDAYKCVAGAEVAALAVVVLI